MDIFLVAIFLKPTQKQAEDGEAPSLVVPATTVLAKDSNQAVMKAMKLVDKAYDGKEDRLDIRVLPFQKCCR